MRQVKIGFLIALLLFPSATGSFGQKLLIYMDLAQTDHLRAYGVAYWALQRDWSVEWLLNYRGGSFMMDESPEIEKLCRLRGVSYQILGGSEVLAVYQRIDESNMEVVLLEKAPEVAVYVPPLSEPWDDAVRLALEYAEIPYKTLWDKETLAGELNKYDWLHLHHEDFTGQFGKFYASFRNADWYKTQVKVNEDMAKKLGFPEVWQLKHAVAKGIKDYVAGGGFLFAMCSACITLDIALSAEGVDIVPAVFDGDPSEPDCQQKLDYRKALAFKDINLEMNPLVYEHSDVDVTQEAHRRGPETYFSLFEFSAKYDPVPTMLTQDHVALIKEFLGQDSGFRRGKVDDSVVIMGEVEGTEELKYIHGNFGRGTFTFLGGHDPEDYQHFIGDPPTRLEFHKNSPGYRLILNNVLFPAAKKKKQKT